MNGHADTALRSWWVLGALSLLQFLIAVDVTVVNVALPSIGADFGVAPPELTWVVVAYSVTGGGLLMLGGRLGDVLGRRRALLAGTSLFGAASLLAGLAPSFGVLVVARLLQGAGEALALPAAMAAIVLLFPEGPRRARALSIWAAVASSGLVLGFVLSGVLTELLGWRSAFLVTVPFVVVVLGGVPAFLPRDRPQRREPLDLSGSVLLTAAPLLFVTGVSGARGPWQVIALAAALLAAVAFVLVERRAAHPLIPPAFFRNRIRVTANVATALLSAALSTSFLLLTFHLQQRAGHDPLETGVALLPLAVTLVLAATLVPRLLGRWGFRACSLTGIALTALGMAAIAVAAGDGGTGFAILAMILIATGMGFGLVGLQYAAVHDVSDEDAGTASGVQRAADQLGGATGIALYTGIGFGAGAAWTDPFVTSCVLAVGGLALAAVVTGAGRAGRP
ncbi:DHA2 family efflux MFS transporter permease subunit [Amycolatopsis endophytica]|uniref:DHA2 family lincomycin resistance protein-like MFS transporter n=1 Tax=Amycolatopsis endophytica TaxID=860233 RepID=A0A853B6S0_9PSEU|nr:MFS transporter [Amycolatopsis endophytica]NYI90769.1 DHA2 family lincomycin resistance protein-like MFS transporter [Amycolatopsis endophytica]